MANIVIFGLRDIASLAHFYLKHDSPHEVVAFCVDQDYLPEPAVFEGKPVVAFEEVAEIYPPGDFMFFAPLSEKNMNMVRAGIYQRIKDQGYGLISYVSSRATVFPGAQIGENCFILEDNTIQPFTPIGNNVVMWSGNHIGHHSTIGDHCFITSHVVVSGHCEVGPASFLGVNSTLRDGIKLAPRTVVGAGATIVKPTVEEGVYVGVAAKLRDQRGTKTPYFTDPGYHRT